MPRFRTLDDLDVAGKRVLVRADLNVPVRDGRVTDATRIERLAPTLAAIIERGGKPVVMSHFGRPKGPDPSQSLRPLVEPLSRASAAAPCISRPIASDPRPSEWSLRCGRARSRFWRICAFTRARRRTIRTSPANSRRSAISMSMTRSRRRTARMPRSRRWRICCRRRPARICRPNWTRSAPRSKTHRGR